MIRKSRFSLIEVLVVMVIMTVLMTMMMPAFNHMMNGSKVDQMTSNLKLGMEQAQSRAVTDRRHVALVLPNRRSVWQDDVKPFCYGGFRLAYVKKIVSGGNTTWELERWVPGSEWKNAPDGAMLVLTSGTDPVNSSGVVTGFAELNSTLLGTRLIDLDSVPDSTLANSLLASGSSADQCLIIFDPYGAMVNQSLYLVAAEAIQVLPNDIKFPSKNGTGISNFLVLKANQFTGKVEYRQL